MSDLVGEIDIILHENKQLREQNRVLAEALRMIEAIICDKKLCGHFTAEEIRAQVKTALTATSQEGQHEL